MNELQTFNNPDFGEIRTVTVNNEPWFVGKDIAEALGFSSPRSAITNHVHNDDKGVEKIDTLGGTQSMTIINESGLYALIFGSRLESAIKFKHWVTSEVLPALKNNGGYVVGQENMTEDEFLAQAIIVAQKTIESLKNRCKVLGAEIEGKTKVIEELQPKASYYDLILQCKELLKTTDIAKDYGMSAIEFNKKLNELGIQFKQGDRWYLYSQYDGFGYTQSKTTIYEDSYGEKHSKIHMYWTQKGRLFLYDFLKKKGIIPMIERGI